MRPPPRTLNAFLAGAAGSIVCLILAGCGRNESGATQPQRKPPVEVQAPQGTKSQPSPENPATDASAEIAAAAHVTAARRFLWGNPDFWRADVSEEMHRIRSNYGFERYGWIISHCRQPAEGFPDGKDRILAEARRELDR